MATSSPRPGERFEQAEPPRRRAGNAPATANRSDRGRSLRSHSRAALLGCLAVTGLLALGAEHRSDLRSRAEYVASLSLEQKRRLLDQRRRFEALPESERQRLRKLYAEISRQENRDALLAVLRNYHRWLSQLPAGERAELLSLPPKERLQQIEQRLRKEEQQRFFELVNQQLTPKDHEIIHSWLKKVIASREARLLEKYPQLKRIEPSRRYRIFVIGMMRSHAAQSELAEIYHPTEQEWEELSRQLCPKAQEFLQSESSSETRKEILWKWVRTAVTTRMHRPVPTRELLEFLKRLPPQERDRLESLPTRNQMMDELRRRYMWDRYRRRGGFGPRPGRGPRGELKGRPGDFPRGRPPRSGDD